MNRQQFIGELETLLEVDPGTLSEDMVLQEIEQWDSMAAIGFIAMADATLSAVVKPQKLFECRSVGDLIELVGDKLS